MVSLFLKNDSLEQQRDRDSHKKESCKKLGITFIEVPFWWDKKQKSLEATIYEQRPDLINEKPVCDVIPITNLKKVKNKGIL